MRVVTRAELLDKVATVQVIDAYGRDLAQKYAVEKLASAAGVFMAHARSPEGLNKLAQSMVYAGELTPDEYEMLKEAGFVGKLLKQVGRAAKSRVTGTTSAIGRGVSGIAAGMGRGVSGAKTRVGRVFKKPVRGQSRDWSSAGSVKPKQQASASFNRASSRRPVQKAAPGGGTPQKSTGSVTPAAKAAPRQAQPQKGGMGWGRPAAVAGAAGIGYGLYKGVPWAVRQLEASSTSPMAYGAGWSPVPYGYGQSPYGAGVQTMGYGA